MHSLPTLQVRLRAAVGLKLIRIMCLTTLKVRCASQWGLVSGTAATVGTIGGQNIVVPYVPNADRACLEAGIQNEGVRCRARHEPDLNKLVTLWAPIRPWARACRLHLRRAEPWLGQFPLSVGHTLLFTISAWGIRRVAR